MQTEIAEQALSRRKILDRFLSTESDPRFLDFSGKIEVNEFGDLLVNAASRIHVVVQNRLALYLQSRLGGESMVEMPVEIPVQRTRSIKIRVPDVSWSAVPGFFDGPEEARTLRRPAELCIEIKSDSNTLKDLRQKREEFLACGAMEVWFIFPDRRRVEIHGAEGPRRKSVFNVDLKDFWQSY